MATHFQIRTDCFVPIKMVPEFRALLCRLSPENLYMDGEASPAQVKRESEEIRLRWTQLENRLGFAVTQADAEKMCYGWSR